jgi:hypothetical protein
VAILGERAMAGLWERAVWGRRRRRDLHLHRTGLCVAVGRPVDLLATIARELD